MEHKRCFQKFCRESHVLKIAASAFIIATAFTAQARASEAVISAYANSQGTFTIMGNNLNRITEANITVAYMSEDGALPNVSAPFLDRKNSVMTSQGGAGRVNISLKCLGPPCKRPFSGYMPIALLDIQGSISSLVAVLRHENGTTETARVSITNPTSEQLKERKAAQDAADEAKRAAEKAEKERLEAEKEKALKDSQVADRSVTDRPGSTDSGDIHTAPAGQGAGRSPRTSAEETFGTENKPVESAVVHVKEGTQVKGLDEEKIMRFIRRESVLDRFRARSGDLPAASLEQLFERSDDMFRQIPPVSLSDGTRTLRLVVRIPAGIEKPPMFYISEAHCVELKSGTNDGIWELELRPRQGSLYASVTVQAGNEMIDFPLAVAPPRELFNGMPAGTGESEYVETANRLATLGNNDIRN
jgi:hypothetical protein